MRAGASAENGRESRPPRLRLFLHGSRATADVVYDFLGRTLDDVESGASIVPKEPKLVHDQTDRNNERNNRQPHGRDGIVGLWRAFASEEG